MPKPTLEAARQNLNSANGKKMEDAFGAIAVAAVCALISIAESMAIIAAKMEDKP